LTCWGALIALIERSSIRSHFRLSSTGPQAARDLIVQQSGARLHPWPFKRKRNGDPYSADAPSIGFTAVNSCQTK
jgi:hypothetical protein